MYEPGVRVLPSKGARSLARVVEPYFERSWKHFCSHFQTPSDKPSPYSGAILKGRVAYIAYPIFSAFAKHGNYPCRLLVRNILDLLLPHPLLRMKAPTSTEATVAVQGKRTIVHLLQYCPERRTPALDIVEDIVPLHDVPLSLKLDRSPRRVYMAPEGKNVPFRYIQGYVELQVPVIHGHAMLVCE